MAAPDVIYARRTLVDVLVYHQRLDVGRCGCGWSVLGASHAEHVADVYEDSCRVRYAERTPDEVSEQGTT